MAFVVAATVVGVGLTAYGAYSSSKQNKKQAKAQTEQANMNAAIAERTALDVVDRGNDSLADQKRATLRSLSSVRAGTAGAGFVVDSAGTTGQQLVQAMAQAGEIDIIRLQENIDREKQRALDQGANFTAQADQYEIQRRGYNPLLSGLTAGASSAIGNADILFPK
jgi:Flp pilus assembly protein TadB